MMSDEEHTVEATSWSRVLISVFWVCIMLAVEKAHVSAQCQLSTEPFWLACHEGLSLAHPEDRFEVSLGQA